MTNRTATCNQSDLAECLTILSKAVMPARQTPYEPLTCILIESCKQGINLTASNLATTMQITVTGKSEGGFRSLVSAKLFTQFVNSLPGGVVELAQNGVKLLVKCGGNTATFTTVKYDDYAPLNGPDGPYAAQIATITPGLLSGILQRGAYAAARDESRPTLCGIKFKLANHVLTVASTDGYRLSRQLIESSHNASVSCIVPHAATQMIATLKDYEAPALELFEDGSKLRFTAFGTDNAPFERILIDAVLVDAKYPDYTAIIPDHTDTVVVADVAELRQTMRIASLLALGFVTLSVTKDSLVVTGKDPEYGESVSVIEVGVTGPELDSIGVDPKFLRDALSQIGTEFVRLGFCGSRRPMTITPDNGAYSANELHLIMPMEIRG